MYTKKEVLILSENCFYTIYSIQNILGSAGPFGASHVRKRTNTFTTMIRDMVDLAARRLDRYGGATGRASARWCYNCDDLEIGYGRSQENPPTSLSAGSAERATIEVQSHSCEVDYVSDDRSVYIRRFRTWEGTMAVWRRQLGARAFNQLKPA